MNETRRKPTTGTDALLFSISGTGSYSRTHTAGHTKIFDYPVMDHWRGSEKAPARGRFDLSVHSRTRQPLDHDDRPESEDQIGPIYPGAFMGGGGRLAPPRLGHPQWANEL